MLQVIHEINGGRTRIADVPPPLAGSGQVLIATTCSVVSSGTERYFVRLALSSVMSKARQRPDHGGGVSNVSYQAGGDRSMPAERIEVIGGGKSAVLDNWSELTVWQNGSSKRTKIAHDKGHAAGLQAFVQAAIDGKLSPILWDHLRATSLAAILAERSAREGVPFELGLP